ncbi:hypothetical protein C8F01DRAFT_1119494 [Mycena amicta]|nr:hypothetical protein C8F01DRAFT_1119494 [Mycena amicta]
MASDAQEQAAQLEQLFRLLAAARTTTSLSIAGLVLIIYDHILTFADEVEHVWKTRFSPANLFYIWIRYFTLITMIINVVFLLEVEDSDKL